MKLSKRIAAFVIAAAMMMCILPVFSNAASSYKAEDFTKVEELIPKLNKVINGGADLFFDKVYEDPEDTADDLKVGGYINPDIRYYWGTESRSHYGWTCFAYAQAVYFYLFGDVLYRCEGQDAYGVKYKGSEVVLQDTKPVSFDILYNAGVGTGAYVEAPNHYYIILTYDKHSITTLGGNEDGYGRGEIKISNYTWDEFNRKGHRVPMYTVVQPTITKNTICNHEYDKESYTCHCGHIDTSSMDHVWHNTYYVVTDKPSSYASPFDHGEKVNTFENGEVIKVDGIITNEKGESCYRLYDKSFINSEFIEPLYVDCPGDIDGDYEIMASDARIALRVSVNLETMEKYSEKFRRADVDYDNKITAADARLILRASVGLENLY